MTNGRNLGYRTAKWIYTIGIVGGLGPVSHIEFERKLLSQTERIHGRPLKDQDYPPWIVSSLPQTPDRTAALFGEESSPIPLLMHNISGLTGPNGSFCADFGVITCNTAHAYIETLREQSGLPLLNMIEETARNAVSTGSRTPKIGILATTGTLEAGIYDQWIKHIEPHAEIHSLLDEPGGSAMQEHLLMEPIYGELKEGERSGGGLKSIGSDTYTQQEMKSRIQNACTILQRSGCETIITACTELSLLLEWLRDDTVHIVDSLAATADAALQIAVGERPLPINNDGQLADDA